MSAADKAAETALNVAADVAGEVSDQAEIAEQTIRALNRAKVSYAVGGWLLGAATGAFFAYKFAYSRAETKYSKISDDAISEMRRHYQEKTRAVEAKEAKRPVGEIVKERGYSPSEKETPPPMAVQPPTPSRVIEAEDEAAGEPPDIPGEDEPPARNIFVQDGVEDPEFEWDWHEERRGRSPDNPYVIHVDEKYDDASQGYDIITVTYYEGDDVLCNDRDEVIGHADRAELIGEGNLLRFGHGSGDPVIVYVRNDKVEIIYEVIRSPHKFAEEVHGFTHDSPAYRNLERMRMRERDEQEDD
jgi:hypothetical protein